MTKKEKKLTHGKRPDILNLNESMVNSLIKKVETDIHKFKEEQNKILPELQEAEQLYMPLKKQYDDLERLVEQETHTLRTLVGIKKGEKDQKEVRVLRSESNEKIKGKRKRRAVTYRWLDSAEEVLKMENKFLSFDTIIRKIIELKPEYALGFQVYAGSSEAGAKTIIRQGFNKNLSTQNPRFVFYNDKYGLPHFVDEHGRPLPKYLASTMQPMAAAI